MIKGLYFKLKEQNYKVDYSYKETTGNVLGNHIVVKITLLNNNFGAKGTEYSEDVALTKKQISSVTVTPVQSSYTYTGAAIVPELIVKDGETELSKGEDYVINLYLTTECWYSYNRNRRCN